MFPFVGPHLSGRVARHPYAHPPPPPRGVAHMIRWAYAAVTWPVSSPEAVRPGDPHHAPGDVYTPVSGMFHTPSINPCTLALPPITHPAPSLPLPPLYLHTHPLSLSPCLTAALLPLLCPLPDAGGSNAPGDEHARRPGVHSVGLLPVQPPLCRGRAGGLCLKCACSSRPGWGGTLRCTCASICIGRVTSSGPCRG